MTIFNRFQDGRSFKASVTKGGKPLAKSESASRPKNPNSHQRRSKAPVTLPTFSLQDRDT